MDHLWSFTGGEQRRNAWTAMGEIPAETDESRAMSADLRKRGFRFVGPTICYALMQSAGLVNDHVVTCFRYDGGRRDGSTSAGGAPRVAELDPAAGLEHGPGVDPRPDDEQDPDRTRPSAPC